VQPLAKESFAGNARLAQLEKAAASRTGLPRC